jgi:hypothetical protein
MNTTSCSRVLMSCLPKGKAVSLRTDVRNRGLVAPVS